MIESLWLLAIVGPIVMLLAHVKSRSRKRPFSILGIVTSLAIGLFGGLLLMLAMNNIHTVFVDQLTQG